MSEAVPPRGWREIHELSADYRPAGAPHATHCPRNVGMSDNFWRRVWEVGAWHNFIGLAALIIGHARR